MLQHNIKGFFQGFQKILKDNDMFMKDQGRGQFWKRIQG